jgi:nucleoid DNA-binding protein
MPRKNKYATTKDIVKAVVKKLKLDEAIVKKIADLYIEEIKKNILEDKQVRLAGFGIIELTKWKPTAIYDINVKEKVKKEIRTLYFHPSSSLKKKILN